MLRKWFMVPLIWCGTARRKGTGRGPFPPPPVCWPTPIQFYIPQPHKQAANKRFRWVRRLRGRNRFQTLHFKETVVPVFIPLFGERDSCGESITGRDHKHVMKRNATRGDCQAALTGMSLLVFPVCMPSALWYSFRLHSCTHGVRAKPGG